MMKPMALGCGVAALVALGSASAGAACPDPVPVHDTHVFHSVTTVNGDHVDLYRWYDSQCLLRSVALRQEGNGNTGHGGYAVQMTYYVPSGTGVRLVKANAHADSHGGFGYFVSHERYRTFTDDSSDTIADKIFHADDSPLGKGSAVVGTVLAPVGDSAAHRFTTTYYHYGTVAAVADDGNGNDVTALPLSAADYAKYALPVTLTWVFEALKDYPRIDVSVDLSQLPGPDYVSFDVRAPYGVLDFDNGAEATVVRVMWGDRYQFVSISAPATRNGSWRWNGLNHGARFNAQIAHGYEMGLFEPRKFTSSALADGYADERGSTSATYNGGQGCSQGETQLLPCDWSWPYQSIQYSLPTDNLNLPTDYKQIAWGSSPFYGTGASLPTVYDTGNTSEAFTGFPASGKIAYSICIVLGQTVSGGLTHNAAAGSASYNCASNVYP